MQDEWEYEQEQEYDQIFGQTTGLLAQRGDEEAVSLMVDVHHMAIEDTDEAIQTETYQDPWTLQSRTRTIFRRKVLLDVEEHLIPRFAEDVRRRILRTLRYVAERNGQGDIAYIEPRPALPELGENWRDTFRNRLTAERPSNQARRERDTKHPVEDALTFGSKEELRVYRALKRLQTRFPEHDTIAIAPLPGIRLRTGNTWSPDVLVMGRGRALIIETDGPYHRSTRRYVDDRNRDLQWQRCGVHVVRIPVEDLEDDDSLDARLKEEILRYLPPP
ncbi:hypothetical protein [Microbispora sp. H10836]|uniref:hypothetical protein n=1 Tax=Microbispora sp. H10836 TaxID=2729106 RepID=UPI0014735C58|nr:hypothetical protein [Microbispora sp. H10836]